MHHVAWGQEREVKSRDHFYAIKMTNTCQKDWKIIDLATISFQLWDIKQKDELKGSFKLKKRSTKFQSINCFKIASRNFFHHYALMVKPVQINEIKYFRACMESLNTMLAALFYLSVLALTFSNQRNNNVVIIKPSFM